MGEEIRREHFSEVDHSRFQQHVAEETALLLEMLAARRFDNHSRRIGYELEYCLADQQGLPHPCNSDVLQTADHPALTTELARFNLEINGTAFAVRQGVFEQLADDLQSLHKVLTRAAQQHQAQAALFGVFPSVMLEHLDHVHYMTPLHRYAELNRRLLEMRERPVELHLDGLDTLDVSKDDVMLEALGTSLQVHLQLPFDDFVPAYNASLWASMLMLGAAPNSPLVLGHRCWHESRVGIFRQSVDTRNPQELADGIEPRVHLAKGWLGEVQELFEDNLNYSPILPQCFDAPASELKHLSLHNGTIWRWVRPIIDFDKEGTPTLRLELRVVAAGPTCHDSIANLVLHVGLVEALRQSPDALISQPFEQLYADFRKVARQGADSTIQWLDGSRQPLRSLLLERLIPAAGEALEQAGYGDASKWLEVCHARCASARSGADWMLAHWQRHGDASMLVRDYIAEAESDAPVHTWAWPA